jgi:hypothetical protein
MADDVLPFVNDDGCCAGFNSLHDIPLVIIGLYCLLF